MTDLISVQIIGLTTAPTLTDTTYVPLQRQGIDKAEKMSLNNLSSYLINSPLFSNFIETSVASKVQIHVSANDPHGDRAYSNTILQNHVTATDPHGDRAFATNKINTDIVAHTTATDPHGDRVYTDTTVLAHKNAVDPHGDRAYTDGKAVDTLTNSKNYTNNEITTKVINEVGVSIAPLVAGKVPNINITKELFFNSVASFPVVGNNTTLYVDTTNDDVYRWKNTAYVNLTPSVDIGNLNLTTNDVAEGSNEDRKYLTKVLKDKYDLKIDKVTNKNTLLEKNNLVDSTVNNEVFIRNITSESNIDVLLDNSNIVLTDNYYTYSTETNTTDVLPLQYEAAIKKDTLTELSDFYIYNLIGNLTCLTYATSDTLKYITDSEKIKIDAYLGLKGNLEVLAVPTDVVINEEGTIITGKGLANKQVKIYNKEYTLINTTNVLGTGDFTASITPAITDGSPIYIYNVDDVYRSKDTKIYSKNTTNAKDVSLLSVDSTGLVLKGNSEKNSTITVEKTGDIQIGTTTTVDGFFEVTLTEAVTDGQEINIKTVTDLGAEKVTNYFVTLSELIAPYEVVVNDTRTSISGKAEPNATILVMDEGTELKNIVVNNDGTFESVITIPTTIDSVILQISKEDLDFGTTLILNNYEDETNKPKENYKVLSSEFGLISSKITRLNNKTKYVFNISDLNDVISLNVNNTSGENTKWILKLKVDKIEL